MDGAFLAGKQRLYPEPEEEEDTTSLKKEEEDDDTTGACGRGQAGGRGSVQSGRQEKKERRAIGYGRSALVAALHVAVRSRHVVRRARRPAMCARCPFPLPPGG